MTTSLSAKRKGRRASAKAPDRRMRSVRVLPSCRVYTPPRLASAMVQALGTSTDEEWLEPSIGTGALLTALSRNGVKAHQITGIDLDARSQPYDRLCTTHRGTEFLKWSLSTQRRFDKIVANPPYIAIERLQKSVRRTACTVRLGNVVVTAGANIWYAFLCASIRLLRPGGSLCFVLPAAWDYANYSAGLRSQIARYFGSVEIYRSRTPLFQADQIQEGAIVLVARKYVGDTRADLQGGHETKRVELEQLDDLTVALKQSSNQTDSDRIGKVGVSAPVVAIPKSRETELLEKHISIHLGAVTGDAKYFLLTEIERKELNLPVAALRPVVSRAKHLSASTLTTKRWNNLKAAGERVWLFHPSAGVLQHYAVAEYLRLGKEQGHCDIHNHKISMRDHWYRTPLPKACHGFLSGMSQAGPWICLRSMDNLTATNTLYVIRYDQVTRVEQQAALALSLLSSFVGEQLDRLARWYADGLCKFEPGDLRRVKLPIPTTTTRAVAVYRDAVAALLAGNRPKARQLADGWLSS